MIQRAISSSFKCCTKLEIEKYIVKENPISTYVGVEEGKEKTPKE